MKKTSTILLLISIVFINCTQNNFELDEDSRVISAADKFLAEEPVTVTNSFCERSAGTVYDYYSEGDYWWPDPDNPDGPYIRRDGLTNPQNFTEHRIAMRRLSIIVPTLVAAYKITNNEKYVQHAIKHLNAWFVDGETKMNSHLLYAQAIKGKVTGRGIGIIDTIHLVEISQAIIVLENLNAINNDDLSALKDWFGKYLEWIMTHQYGIKERDNGNNHSTCWAMQVASFAKLTGNDEALNYVRNLYKENLLPTQMDLDGSFPKEIKRTKPYGYSIFNLDAMVMVCEIASTSKDNLWSFKTEDGKSIKKGLEFLYPYLKDKNLWPYQKDVMYWDNWPVRQPSLLFGALRLADSKYFELWSQLDSDPEEKEIIRNFPIRQPILWIN